MQDNPDLIDHKRRFYTITSRRNRDPKEKKKAKFTQGGSDPIVGFTVSDGQVMGSEI